MTTPKYDLNDVDFSVQGWDTIMGGDMDILDAVIHTRIAGLGGEISAQYSAMYLKNDGKYWKAQADGSKQPCMGLALESVAADVAFRLQRIGPITNAGWAWATVGGLVFLDPTTPGALTQTDPVINRNIVGVALSATSIFLMLSYEKAIPDKKVQTLTCADNVTVNWSLGSIAKMTFDRAAVNFTFTGSYSGQKCILVLTQDVTGGRTITFSGGEVRGSDDLSSPPTLSGSNKTDYLGYIYNLAATKYDFLSVNKGFA